MNFKIECRCGRYITYNEDLYRLSFYKVKKPTQGKINEKRVIEETFYFYVCPECGRDVVLIKRKGINAAGNKCLIPNEKLIGEKAAAYMELTAKNRINKTTELTSSVNDGVYAKGVPLSYFKCVSATVQRPRYINEAGYSGAKVESTVKVLE